MKKTLLLLFAALMGGVVSSSASITEEDVPFTAIEWSGTNIVPSTSKVQLEFTAENNYYKLTQTTFDRTTYPKYRIDYELLSGSVNVKIQSETQQSSGYSGQYDGLSSSNTSYTGTFSTESGLDDDVNINTFQLQANGGAATIKVNKVVLIKSDNSETELTDGIDGWNSHPAYFSGTISITKNWGGLGLTIPSSFTERDQVTYTIEFGTATAHALQLQTVATGEIKHYPDVVAGSTEFSYTVKNEELTEVWLKNGGVFSDSYDINITSIKRTVKTQNILNTETVYSGSKTFDGWGVTLALPANPQAKVGDIIQVNFSESVSNQNFKFANINDGWADIAGFTAYGSLSGTSIEFVLDQTFVDLYHQGYVGIQGQTFTVSTVELLTTDNSVVPITFPAGKTLISYSPSTGVELDVTDVDGLKAYIVSDVTKTAVNLSETKGVIGDGTGYILEGTAGATYNLPVVASAPSYVGLNKLYGSGDTPSSVEANTKYVLYNGKFCLFTGTEIPAHKAYLDASEVPDASANELTLNFGDDDVTAIKNIKVGTEDNVYYDLQGRRVLYPTKGLYIVNGKKVIVK